MPRGSNPSLEVFLQLNFPWKTAAQAQLYKTVSWTFTGSDGLQHFANFSAQDYDALIRLCERQCRVDSNLYMALGTQAIADVANSSKDGYAKAIRRHDNIVSFNSLYVDIDVNKPGAYKSTAEARAAVEDVSRQIGLPDPSMMVLSGSGGIHCYWNSDDPIPIQEWRTLAGALSNACKDKGLLFDPQCTVNPAGILRVPGSFNVKKYPPTQVVLATGTTFRRYPVAALERPLLAYVGKAMPRPMAIAGGGGTTGINRNFMAGVSEAPVPPLDDVAMNCAAVAEAIATGGASHPEPLWNTLVMLASFTDDQHAAAHRMSHGHPGYDHAGTEKKLAEKLTARANNPNLGWPQCAQIAQYHSACATCPLFQQGKSPLNFLPRSIPAAVPASPPKQNDELMPQGYWRDVNDNVWTTNVSQETNVSTDIDIVRYPVRDAFINEENQSLVTRVVIGGIDRWVELEAASSVTPNGVGQSFAKAGIWIAPARYPLVRSFLVSWMQHLQAKKRTISPATFGWTLDGTGFTFDNITYTPAGETLAYRGPTREQNYSAVGELSDWQESLKLVKGNIPLEVIVASAFAAPLVTLVGSSSVVMSIYSAASGVGKSTAMQIGQAVWGHPVSGMSALNDTNNSVMKKVADLKSLPIYWDELRTTTQLEKVIDLVFSITQGKAKARLSRDSKQMGAPDFRTMFVVASNYGLEDTVYSQTEGTEAGGLRVFEIEAWPTLQGSFKAYESMKIIGALGSNYGKAGAFYADYLARNKATIDKVINAIMDRFYITHNCSAKERFWVTTVVTLLAGARIANHCGLTSFDLPGMEKFLVASLSRMRRILRIQDFTTINTPDAAMGILSELVSELRDKHLIVTETIFTGAGKPLPARVMSPTDPNRLADVWMQMGEKDGRIRIRVRPFNEWLRERKLRPDYIKRLLAKNYFMTQGKLTIGAGVPGLDVLDTAGVGRSECLDLWPIPKAGSSPSTTLGSS